MPIYEFRCLDCDKKFSILFRTRSMLQSHVCPECGGNNTERVISTFAYHRSGKDILEAFGEPTLSPKPDYYKDPRNIGRWTEKRFKQLGLDVPPEINRQIQSAREGELPVSEKEMLGN
jgi:putative FmdB family regulatory protein